MPADVEGRFGYWRDPVFFGALGIYALNREVMKPHLSQYSPFFHGHLNDTLLVPVALPLFLLVYRRLGLRPDDMPPRSWEIALHLLVWTFFFKGFGPVILHRGVSDPFDVGCYVAGGVLAWTIWNWPHSGSLQRTLES